MNPYKIEGPAMISYSGGRTSAYMLRHILDAHGGTLPPDVFVCFADTGKERPETYEFVEETQRRWGFDLHRVMYPGGFEQLIRDRGYLPNPVARICTHHLKVKMMHTWMLGQCEGDWCDVLGLRYDEPRRWASKVNKVNRIGIKGSAGRCHEYDLPLVRAKVSVSDVLAWWRAQPFDLQLQPYEGNCDLCFLKGREKRIRIIMERPELADWWIRMEDEMGKPFRREESYRDLVREADRRRRQLPLFPEQSWGLEHEITGDPTDLGVCECHD